MYTLRVLLRNFRAPEPQEFLFEESRDSEGAKFFGLVRPPPIITNSTIPTSGPRFKSLVLDTRRIVDS